MNRSVSRETVVAVGMAAAMLAACGNPSSSDGDMPNDSGDVSSGVDDVANHDALDEGDLTADISDAVEDVEADTPDADAGDASSDAERLRQALDPAPCLNTGPVADWPEERVWGDMNAAWRYSPISFAFAAADLDAFEEDPRHGEILAARRQRRVDAVAFCGDDRACLVNGFAWSNDEIAQAVELIAAFADDTELADIADYLSTTIGWPWGFEVPDDAALVEGLFDLTAQVQARALGRALGDVELSRLPGIVTAHNAISTNVVFDALVLTTELLLAVGRDEAFRYGPHAISANADMLDAIGQIDFDAYPYAAILVPGQGPTDLETPLSALGAQRVDLAAERFRAGLAPIILTSGGHVHPFPTPYGEALEMRRYAIETHGIAPSSVAVDPYARHTTTNLRNAARTLHALGVPLDRPVLVTSDPFQTVYIAASVADRALDELGYVPWMTISQLGRNDSCVILSPESLRIDVSDELDP